MQRTASDLLNDIEGDGFDYDDDITDDEDDDLDYFRAGGGGRRRKLAISGVLLEASFDQLDIDEDEEEEEAGAQAMTFGDAFAVARLEVGQQRKQIKRTEKKPDDVQAASKDESAEEEDEIVASCFVMQMEELNAIKAVYGSIVTLGGSEILSRRSDGARPRLISSSRIDSVFVSLDDVVSKESSEIVAALAIAKKQKEEENAKRREELLQETRGRRQRRKGKKIIVPSSQSTVTSVVSKTETSVDLASQIEPCQLQISLPHTYPVKSAPVVFISWKAVFAEKSVIQSLQTAISSEISKHSGQPVLARVIERSRKFLRKFFEEELSEAAMLPKMTEFVGSLSEFLPGGNDQGEDYDYNDDEVSQAKVQCKLLRQAVSTMPLKVALYDHLAVRRGTRVYLLGGRGWSADESRDFTDAPLRVFDLVSRQWSAPRLQYIGQAKRLPVLFGVAGARVNKLLVLYGGETVNQRSTLAYQTYSWRNYIRRINGSRDSTLVAHLRSIWVINLQTLEVECRHRHQSVVAWEQRPPPLFYHTMTRSRGNRVLLVGGYTKGFPAGKPNRHCFEYDVFEDEWFRLPEISGLPNIHAHTTTRLSASKYLLFGGIVDMNASSTLWLLDLDSASCLPVPVAKDCPYRPIARSNHQAHLINETLYVLGGRAIGDACLNFADCCDLSTRRWSRRTLTGRVGGSVPFHSASVLVDSTVYMYGGAFPSSGLSTGGRPVARSQLHARSVSCAISSDFLKLEMSPVMKLPSPKLCVDFFHYAEAVFSRAAENTPATELAAILQSSSATGADCVLELGSYATSMLSLPLHRSVLAARCPQLLPFVISAESGGGERAEHSSSALHEMLRDERNIASGLWRRCICAIYSACDWPHAIVAHAQRAESDVKLAELLQVSPRDQESAELKTRNATMVSAGTSEEKKQSEGDSDLIADWLDLGSDFEKLLPAEVTRVIDQDDISLMSKEEISTMDDSIETFADATIVCAETMTEFPVHTLFLRRFAHFRTLLDAGMEESRTKKIVVHAPEIVIAALLIFMYTGKAQFAAEDAVQVMQIANQFDIVSLKAHAEMMIKKYYDFESLEAIMGILEVADQYNSLQLKKLCLYLLKNQFELVEIRAAATEAEIDNDLLDEIIQSFNKC